MATSSPHQPLEVNAETTANSSEARTVLPPQHAASGIDAGASLLSSHQKTLLAGFGVSTTSTSVRRPPVPTGRAGTEPRQDLPAFPETEPLKEVAPSSFRPTFNRPQSNVPFHPKHFIMALGSFDPSKYGAQSRKQKPINEKTDVQVQSAKAASDDLTLAVHPISEKAPHSHSMTQPTRSETTNKARSLQTQSTEASINGPKRTASNGFRPKSTNRISIPGFDPSKYGKPILKANRNPVHAEQESNTGGAIGPRNLTASAVGIPPRPPSIEREATPSTSHSQTVEGSEEKSNTTQRNDQHPVTDQLPLTSVRGGVDSNRGSESGENKSTQLPYSVASTRVTARRDPRTETSSRPGRASPMVSSSLPSALPDMSKEDRLKGLQQAKLREISLKKRSKAAPDTTSSRDLNLAQTPAVFETQPLDRPPPPAALPLDMPTPSDRVPTRVISTPVQAEKPRNEASNGTHRSPASIVPLTAPGMTKDERLKQVQRESLRKIGIRNRTKGGDPETTSLMDLHIARTPTTPAYQGPSSSQNTTDRGQAEGMESFQDTATNPDQLAIRDAQDNVTLSSWSVSPEKKSRNPRWCTNDELRPIQANLETNSNAWGSDVPSSASIATNDSTRPMQLHGKLFKGPPADDRDEVEALVGWDGKMQPPPVDWNDRPRFNNNSPAFRNGFNNWFATVAPENCEFVDRTPMFKQIPLHVFSNMKWHADGIGMVRKEYTLDAQNISKYGYSVDSADVAKYAEPVTAEDFADWGKLDMSEPDNVTYKDETTEQLVNNWQAHQERSKKTSTLATMHANTSLKESKAHKPESNPNKPIVNIYLRPAVSSDIRQLTELYNWWVENSVRPAETRPIEFSDMQERFGNSKSDSLPFIVAILKGKHHVPRDHYTGIKGEQIVGFALATGFTAPDYVEHIAAELEIYVHHEYRRQGVGHCLLDRLMCATDRGHMERGGYPFHCDPAERHWYEVGGARNLHKLAFVARHHSRPKKDCTEEVDVTTWLKKWLVKDWDFEQEAYLKQTGAKCGRFLDLSYFCKFSKWLPDEGRVPDPEPKDHKHAPVPGQGEVAGAP